jgi:hypothetical protein
MASKVGTAAKVAAVKGLRTFLQTFAGALIALPVVASVADIKVQAPALIVATYVAVSAGIVSFLQNFAEGL